MRDLPNPTLLVVFEAAARHRSFTRAAGELNVQQPAVSRQIAVLEQELGTKLFVRSKPLLTLTPDGEALQASVSAGLDGIRQAVRAIRDQRPKGVLVVNAAIGFTSLFLMPRLAEFQARHPDIGLEVVTRDQNTGFDPRLNDVVLTFGSEGLAGAPSRRVLQEELYAMCAPMLLEANGLLSPEQLVQQRLIHMSSADHADDWLRFFAGTGVTPVMPGRLERLFSFMVYLHAVQNGNGIGLGWTHVTDSLIDSGRLRLASDRKVRTDRGYHCNIMAPARDKPEALVFMDWITSLVAGD